MLCCPSPLKCTLATIYLAVLVAAYRSAWGQCNAASPFRTYRRCWDWSSFVARCSKGLYHYGHKPWLRRPQGLIIRGGFCRMEVYRAYSGCFWLSEHVSGAEQKVLPLRVRRVKSHKIARETHQNHLRLGLRSIPHWGSLRLSPDPLVGWGRGHPFDAFDRCM